jgi:hypothetical protein
MKRTSKRAPFSFNDMNTIKNITPAILFLISVLALSAARADSTSIGRVYATPQEAVADLRAVTGKSDRDGLRAILGPASEELENPDRVQGAQEFAKFSAVLAATNHLVHVNDTNVIVEMGPDLWPFPIPLVKERGGWHFDTEAGREELLNRRIGRNELEVLSVMRQYVDAQREYASQDRDGDKVLEYAQKLASSEGKTDGLYWPTELNGQISPLGPLVADARAEGYRKKSATDEPQPFHGYYFKILTSQGKHAPGGKYDYVINGNMIGGFAMVAWPADYGDSGIMTFVVNQEGRVYQKDLGADTAKAAKKITAYDPDSTWKESRE